VEEDRRRAGAEIVDVDGEAGSVGDRHAAEGVPRPPAT
jgi:hypothetical protein